MLKIQKYFQKPYFGLQLHIYILQKFMLATFTATESRASVSKCECANRLL